METSSTVAIHWFRKGLRLHDNPALLDACRKANKIYPVFCIDPYFAKPDVIGVNRYSFLLETLTDLDMQLRAMGSRLFVVKGKPDEMITACIHKWKVNLLTFEKDTEPYAQARDRQLAQLYHGSGVTVSTASTHTLYDLQRYVDACDGPANVPLTYTAFCKLFSAFGKPRTPLPPPTAELLRGHAFDASELNDPQYSVPTLTELGYTELPTTTFRGGETEALRRLQATVINRPMWVRSFEKPFTSPNSLEPSTTVLSPYLKFGCLSVARFAQELFTICNKVTHTEPPVSLLGQLLWREFFYLASYTTPNFHKAVGNPRCRQIPWDNDPEKLLAWKEGRTGFPFIDAIMTQLRVEGWVHHLARHAVACFLTRGDLWQHWEEGAKIFDLWLLDDDYALNNANWQWLSCSNFYYQYFRCYSPVAFGKKTDPNGDYIRKWLPKLGKFPKQYIYEPWTAPKQLQQTLGCVIGVDYPHPIVDHTSASKLNMQKMQIAYANQATGGREPAASTGQVSPVDPGTPLSGTTEETEVTAGASALDSIRSKPRVKAASKPHGIHTWMINPSPTEPQERGTKRKHSIE